MQQCLFSSALSKAVEEQAEAQTRQDRKDDAGGLCESAGWGNALSEWECNLLERRIRFTVWILSLDHEYLLSTLVDLIALPSMPSVRTHRPV